MRSDLSDPAAESIPGVSSRKAVDQLLRLVDVRRRVDYQYVEFRRRGRTSQLGPLGQHGKGLNDQPVAVRLPYQRLGKLLRLISRRGGAEKQFLDLGLLVCGLQAAARRCQQRFRTIE
ncbi:hypothetical protein OG234_14345 [Streptomyces sp. NBC_01420]|uniref:hypothetical protein n=1 Tax=Streptomyces sp. NBC_01420 TaxID=2903858 RepID=UPI00324AAA13